MSMDRRSFLRNAGFTVLGVFSTLIPWGRKSDVELLSLSNEVYAADQENMPEGCRSKSKGLSRCWQHTGSLRGITSCV